MTNVNTTSNTTPLSTSDRAYNKALDHGAVAGAYTHIAARASVAGLKKGGLTTHAYTTGFTAGFLAGWRSVK